MSYVVDASVVIKLVIDEPGSEQVLPLREHDLFAPDLMFAEITNILWKKVRRGDLTAEMLAMAADLFQQAPIKSIPCQSLADDALDLALRLDHPAYDMFYVALARLLDLPLITADLKLVQRLRSGTGDRNPACRVIALTEFQPGASAPSLS